MTKGKRRPSGNNWYVAVAATGFGADTVTTGAVEYPEPAEVGAIPLVRPQTFTVLIDPGALAAALGSTCSSLLAGAAVTTGGGGGGDAVMGTITVMTVIPGT